MENLFLKSKEEKRKIMIFYMDQKLQVTQRIIRIVEIKDDSIVAFCYYRKAVRTFKKSSILSAGPLRKKRGA